MNIYSLKPNAYVCIIESRAVEPELMFQALAPGI